MLHTTHYALRTNPAPPHPPYTCTRVILVGLVLQPKTPAPVVEAFAGFSGVVGAGGGQFSTHRSGKSSRSTATGAISPGIGDAGEPASIGIEAAVLGADFSGAGNPSTMAELMYVNFDIILDHSTSLAFSQRYATPHAPCNVLYLATMLNGCRLALASDWLDWLVWLAF